MDVVEQEEEVAGITGEAEPPQQGQRLQHLFDPWLTSSHPFVTGVGSNLTRQHWDWLDGQRQRRIKPRDQENREAITRAVLANLAYAVAMGFDPPAIGVRLRAGKQKKTRYDREGFTALPRIVEALAEPDGVGTLKLTKSTQWGYASAIEPAPHMLEHLSKFRWKPEHFGRAPGREVIWLRRTIRDSFGNVVARELEDYDDTPQADRYREEVHQINAALAAADLKLDDYIGPPVATNLRELHRVFNLPPEKSDPAPPFSLGGRLAGGWWMQLPRERRPAIRIGGKPIAELDFASMALRLAYAEAGEKPPAGDLYATIPGLSDARWRPGVKTVVLAMLFRRTPLQRVPRGTRGTLPGGVSAAELRTAILAAHPALAEVFERGLGLRLLKAESDILVRALLEMGERGIVGLGLHDAVLCARGEHERVARIMGDAAEAVTGHRLPIEAKAHYD